MLPRLLMPSSLALPPVEYCRGTRPSQAAKSRPLRKAAPLPMAATMAVATIGPIPGICRMRVTTRIGGEDRFQLKAEFFNLGFDCLPLVPKKIDQVPHLRCQVEVGVLNNVRQRGPQLRWSLCENQAALEQKRTQLVDDRSASRDQTIANSMDGLQIELVIGLDRNE